MRRAMLQNIVGVCPYSNTETCDFLLATGITDTTIGNAINDLITDLKTASIYTKINAIYPFVGGDSSTHKYNLIDPRDLDVAFRLVFVSTWTHDSNGATPDLASYADTFILANTLDVNSHGLSFAYNTTNAQNGSAIGVNGGTSSTFRTLSRTLLTGGNADSTFSGADAGDGTAEGVVTTVKQSSSLHKTFKNGALIATGGGGGSLPALDITIGKVNGTGGTANTDTKRFCFASIHEGLSDTEVAALHLAVDAFNTALSRKTW